MKITGIVALVVVGIVIATVGIVIGFTSSNSEVLPAVKQALQQAGDGATSNDTRTLAEGQDQDSKTQVKDVEHEKKETSSEQFTAQTFVLEPDATKRIIFQTAADAESVKMQGKVTIQGPGTVGVSVDRKYCSVCGPFYVFGDASDAVPSARNGVIDIPLKVNAEETLVIENYSKTNQTVSLNLQIVYQTKA